VTEQAPARRVIEGGVDARASGASVALNSPDLPAFFYREVQHFRVLTEPSGRQLQVTMFERIPEGGEWPETLARFQGLGRLNAETPLGHVEKTYRFDLPGLTQDEAWRAFDQRARESGEEASNQLRLEVAQAMRARADQLAVPPPGQAAAILKSPILGPGGQPMR